MSLLLTSALRRAEALFGAREGVVCGEVRLSYSDFGDRIRRLAAGLGQLGIGPGDRVATLLRNCHRYLEAYIAIPALGAAIVPLNTRHTVREHRAILADCGARLLLFDEVFVDLAGQLSETVERVLLVPEEYERLVASSDPIELEDRVDEDDLAGIFYTGGTSGAAKGVMLSHRNLVTNALHMTVAAAYDERDTFLHAAPMFHLADGSSIHALTWRGARHVVLPSFEPGTVLETMSRERVTCTIMVPTMIAALVSHPSVTTTDLSALRLILHGGAPITTDLLNRAVGSLDCSFTQAYGLTEASSHVAMLQHEERLLDDPRLRAAGRPVMGIELQVRRSDGSMCPPREIGEVVVRGPTVTSGYWNNPEETARVLRDGWFWTGDLGYLDEEGYIYLVDRAKDMIISGGENVFSVEVEDVIGTHPAVAAVAVIGVPDPIWGERVHAVVVPQSDQQVDLGALQSHCRERLAGYKCPRSVEFVDSLPLSGAGKVLKRVLRARYQSAKEHQVT